MDEKILLKKISKIEIWTFLCRYIVKLYAREQETEYSMDYIENGLGILRTFSPELSMDTIN